MNDTTGMGWVRAELHPDDHQKFNAKLDAGVVALRKRAAQTGGTGHTDGSDGVGLRYDQYAAAAFMGLVTSTRAAAQTVPEVAVLIDLDTLRGGTHADSTCEYSDGTPLPVATARRHACNANIIPIGLDGDGRPLDVGRAKRHATPAQRHALRAMYRTCASRGRRVVSKTS